MNMTVSWDGFGLMGGLSEYLAQGLENSIDGPGGDDEFHSL